MDVPLVTQRSGFRFLNLLCSFAILALLAMVIVQQQQIRTQNDQVAQNARRDRIVLISDPASLEPVIHAYVRGEYVRFEEVAELEDTNNKLKVMIRNGGLSGTINGQAIKCQFLCLHPRTGELQLDDPATMEWIGFVSDAT
ncbi:MAG: hypothetical protein KDA78_06185 [Planctomycetaceae bacterium]|nr:hypothetical protein [Planctomycetaceae bacterium]